MKKLTLVVSALLMALPVFAGPHDRIDDCGGDVTCIAHVLVDVMKRGRGRPGGDGGSPMVIIYGNSDSCSSSSEKFKARLGSLRPERCDRLASAMGNFSVWSVKVAGNCRNISDTNFRHACKTYIAE